MPALNMQTGKYGQAPANREMICMTLWEVPCDHFHMARVRSVHAYGGFEYGFEPLPGFACRPPMRSWENNMQINFDKASALHYCYYYRRTQNAADKTATKCRTLIEQYFMATRWSDGCTCNCYRTADAVVATTAIFIHNSKIGAKTAFSVDAVGQLVAVP